MELNYIKCGDYYIPDIKLKNPNIRFGKWGVCARSICDWHTPLLSPKWYCPKRSMSIVRRLKKPPRSEWKSCSLSLQRYMA